MYNPSTAARDAPALGDVTFPADTAGARGPRATLIHHQRPKMDLTLLQEQGKSGKTHSCVYKEENRSRSCGKICLNQGELLYTERKIISNTVNQFNVNQSSVITLFTRTFFGLFMYKNVEIMQTEGGFEPNTS